MPITRLTVGNFRNLKNADLTFDRVSFIYGDNGSGKTSLLEAISTLSLGRSFRTRKFRNLIAHDQHELHLFCEFVQEGAQQRLGAVRKRDGTSTFKIDSTPIVSAADLASLLPCQLIDSHSFKLLEGGPGERRHFLDWLVFHVKPDFRRWWAEYRRCLQQRNSLLRSDRMQALDLAGWNLPLATSGERIDHLRREALEYLMEEANVLLQECRFTLDGDLTVTFDAGWDRTQPLLQQLEGEVQRDVGFGYTGVGPHRADIKFVFNRKPVAEVFSRGQLKTMIAALYVAQIRVFRRFNPRNCILLIDDLPSELDQNSLQLLCKWLSATPNLQIFITSVDLRTTLSNWPHKDYKLFHVKQGQITEQQAIGAST